MSITASITLEVTRHILASELVRCVCESGWAIPPHGFHYFPPNARYAESQVAAAGELDSVSQKLDAWWKSGSSSYFRVVHPDEDAAMMVGLASPREVFFILEEWPSLSDTVPEFPDFSWFLVRLTTSFQEHFQSIYRVDCRASN